MFRRIVVLALFVCPLLPASAADPTRVLPERKVLEDSRFEKLRTLNDAYHPWTPPATLQEWKTESERIRRQLLVATGLWPMPPKTPLEPVVHGKVEREGYTIERVFFESLPGFYVTGSLFRPTKIDGKAPGVLCPHGHWANSRFYDAGEKAAQKLIEQGGEKYMSGARHHLQARMVHLARMGCVVFHYDMVGYSDSRQIDHRAGFTDVQAGLRLQNFMGLQTWNSIRALDFLCSLPDVDTSRIGVTGASGGGTQTFVLCAIDPRPTVAFPAVMVSTAMQGGCICENADYLRIGLNNVAFAALFAPKPMALSGANDWTVNIETKGYPELQQVYALYGAREKVYAEAHPEFGHNYNYVSRRIMYGWFKKYLHLPDEAPLEETDFVPALPDELTVFTTEHPMPDNATDAEGVKKYLTKVEDEQYAALLPKTKDDLAEYRRIVGGAADVMLDDETFGPHELTIVLNQEDLGDGLSVARGMLTNTTKQELVPLAGIVQGDDPQRLVVWIDDRGKSHLVGDDRKPRPEIAELAKAGCLVLSADLFLTGEHVGGKPADRMPVDKRYSGYTYGYNKPLLSQRVRDLRSLLLAYRNRLGSKPEIVLVGTGRIGGTCAVLARGLVGDVVSKCVVDLDGFSFSNIESTGDPMYLPGALRYGGIGGLAALGAPHPLVVGGWNGVVEFERRGLEACYGAAEGELTLVDEELSREQIVARILGK